MIGQINQPITISEPQRLTITPRLIARNVQRLRSFGMDVHEFATAYVDRTELLGYPPDLLKSATEFIEKRYWCED